MKKLHFLFATILVGIALMASSCGSKDAIGPGEKRSDGNGGGNNVSAPTVRKTNDVLRFETYAVVFFNPSQSGTPYYLALPQTDKDPKTGAEVVSNPNVQLNGVYVNECDEKDPNNCGYVFHDKAVAGKENAKEVYYSGGAEKFNVFVVVMNDKGVVGNPLKIEAPAYTEAPTLKGRLYEITFASNKFTAKVTQDEYGEPLLKGSGKAKSRQLSKSAAAGDKGDTVRTIGKTESSIQNVVNAIRKEAAGSLVRIEFVPDSKGNFDIGSQSLTFENAGGESWSYGDYVCADNQCLSMVFVPGVSLFGKITGSVAFSETEPKGVVTVGQGVTVAVRGTVENKNAGLGVAVSNNQGQLTIDQAGSVTAAGKLAVYSVYPWNNTLSESAVPSDNFTYNLFQYNNSATVNVAKESIAGSEQFVSYFENNHVNALLSLQGYSTDIGDVMDAIANRPYTSVAVNFVGFKDEPLDVGAVPVEIGTAWDGKSVTLSGSITGCDDVAAGGVIVISSASAAVTVINAVITNTSATGNAILKTAASNGVLSITNSVITADPSAYAIYNQSTVEIRIDPDSDNVVITGQQEGVISEDRRLINGYQQAWIYGDTALVFDEAGNYFVYWRDRDVWGRNPTVTGEWTVNANRNRLILNPPLFGVSEGIEYATALGYTLSLTIGANTSVYVQNTNPALGDVRPPVVTIFSGGVSARTETGAEVKLQSTKSGTIYYYVCGGRTAADNPTPFTGYVPDVPLVSPCKADLTRADVRSEGVAYVANGTSIVDTVTVNIPMEARNTRVVFVVEDSTENKNVSDMLDLDLGVYQATLDKASEATRDVNTIALVSFFTNHVGQAYYDVWDPVAGEWVGQRNRELGAAITSTQLYPIQITDRSVSLTAGRKSIFVWLTYTEGGETRTSNRIEFDVTGEVAPTITFGNATELTSTTNRTSNTQVTFQVNSDEAGSLWYSTTQGTPAQITTSGTQITANASAGTQNYTATGLTYGNQTLYISLKSAATGRSSAIITLTANDAAKPTIPTASLVVVASTDVNDNEVDIQFKSDEPGTAYFITQDPSITTTPAFNATTWISESMVANGSGVADVNEITDIKIFGGNKDIYFVACDAITPVANCTDPVQIGSTVQDIYAPQILTKEARRTAAGKAMVKLTFDETPTSVEYFVGEAVSGSETFTTVTVTANEEFEIDVDENDDNAQIAWFRLSDNTYVGDPVSVEIPDFDTTDPEINTSGVTFVSRTNSSANITVNADDNEATQLTVWYSVKGYTADPTPTVTPPTQPVKGTPSTWSEWTEVTTKITANTNASVSVTVTGGDKEIYVVVVDVAGNVSSFSNVTASDAYPPTISVASYSVTASSTKGTLTITGFSADEDVEWFWNTSNNFDEYNTASMTSGTLTVTNMTIAAYGGNIYIFAQDKAGSPNQSTGKQVAVRKFAPTVTAGSGTFTIDASGGASVSFTSDFTGQATYVILESTETNVPMDYSSVKGWSDNNQTGTVDVDNAEQATNIELSGLDAGKTYKIYVVVDADTDNDVYSNDDTTNFATITLNDET